MTRRTWGLFLLVGLLWGVPYLFIKVAVRDFSPAVIVCGRTAIGALVLIPLAIANKSIIDAIRGWRFVLLYAVGEMVGPWFLITTAEKKISSGLAGLLIATVPIWSTIITSLYGDKTVWQRRRLFGIAIGFIGVVALVGIESITGNASPLAIGIVVISAVLYAYSTIMVTTNLPNVSGLAINSVAMAFTAILFLPFAIAQWPVDPISLQSGSSLIALGIFSTAMAFYYFFIVMAEIGPARASLVTYLNTAFAVLLGVIILGEKFTLGIAIGLPLVLIGSYFASRKTTTSVQ
jgi:drug/metabolite transporter (DMT)-like permease